jgi:hypothetical protein
MCANDWFWAFRIDCLTLVADEQEIVWVQPHPAVGAIQVASCLAGHPLEGVAHTQPLLINVQYVSVMVENWEASFRNGGIDLSWSIQETEKVPGFEVSKSTDGSGSWQRLPDGLVFADGLDFSISDRDLRPGASYRYRVEYIVEGDRKILFETGAVNVPVLPVALRQNSPNPFNPTTSIGFYLPNSGSVRLEIFDVNGRLVDILADGSMSAGEHSVDWDGRDRTGSNVSSGVYFYRLIAGKEILSRKMVLLR